MNISKYGITAFETSSFDNHGNRKTQVMSVNTDKNSNDHEMKDILMLTEVRFCRWIFAASLIWALGMTLKVHSVNHYSLINTYKNHISYFCRRITHVLLLLLHELGIIFSYLFMYANMLWYKNASTMLLFAITITTQSKMLTPSTNEWGTSFVR